SLWFSILETVPLSQANAFTFLSPFIAVVLGVMFFGESISFATAAGLALTTVGVIFVERGPRSRYTK
ncbi:MAG: DMT family transporter, partial [Hyphomonadaceae bacterium]|nr:DMT family transporter [Hyphomonadaceae bacterium]